MQRAQPELRPLDENLRRLAQEASQDLQNYTRNYNDALEKQIAFFEHHQDKMRYKTYRDQGLFYGSGVVEGGCKSVIGQRLKESGMFWTETGATNVLALRIALKSNRWDECWDRLNNSDYLKIKIAA